MSMVGVETLFIMIVLMRNPVPKTQNVKKDTLVICAVWTLLGQKTRQRGLLDATILFYHIFKLYYEKTLTYLSK